MFSPTLFNHSQSGRRSSSRNHPKPLSQRNLLSAFFGLASVVFLAASIVEPRWFHVKGGRCSGHYMGIYKVLALKTNLQLKKACYNDDTTLKLKLIMTFLCFGSVCSFFACLLDIWGPSRKILRILRANSVGNVITAVMASISCAFAYWVTVSIKNFIHQLAAQSPVHVHVSFSYSFYLVVAGGTCALFACAFNMINCNCRRRGDQLTNSEEELTAELMYSMDAALPSTIRGEPPPVYSV